MDPKPLSKEKLTEQYYEPVYAYCLRRLPDREAAEDAAQEVFAAFWEGPEFTEERAASGWLYRVARSKITDFYRERQKRLEHETGFDPEDLDETMFRPPPDETGDSDRIYDRMLMRLDEEERSLFADFWVEGYSYAELAAMRGVTEGAMRTRVSRLKKKITAILKKLLCLPLIPLISKIVYNLFSKNL